MIKQYGTLKKKILGFFYKISEYSQAGQDLFAIELFGKNGTYIDIGAGEPIDNSNSYNLEVNYEWRGFCVDFNINNKKLWELCSERKNKIYWEDALKFGYDKAILENNLPFNVDFLSCDIDPQDKTFLALKKIINDGVRPKYIAFETDKYKENVDYSKLAEEFLKPYGYKIGVKNVYSNLKRNKIFETWFLQSNLNFKTIEYKTWINKIKW